MVRQQQQIIRIVTEELGDHPLPVILAAGDIPQVFRSHLPSLDRGDERCQQNVEPAEVPLKSGPEDYIGNTAKRGEIEFRSH